MLGTWSSAKYQALELTTELFLTLWICMDYERPILLTNYWEQSPFSEANTSMATQEDPALYGNQRCSVTCHSQKREAKVYNLKLSHKETQTVEHILLSRNTNC
jgi:hypothetical protein